MGWLRARHDLDDERVLIGVTGGVLWLVGAIAGVLAQLMPGAPDIDPYWYAGLATGVMVYGLWSISGLFDWSRVSVAGHIAAAAVLMPVIGLVLWATGGQQSYLQPLLILPLLHVAYFFPWKVSIPLALELVVVTASPAVYEERLVDGSPSRLVCFAVIALVVVVVLRVLKTRLLEAEARQREMATVDVLTGLTNRRGFDERLHAAVAASGEADTGRRAADDRPGFALLLFDLDRFKDVNDTLGHPAGDRLLRAVAAACGTRMRPGDTFARVGGDEFAIIAPEAGASGAERLARELGYAARAVGAQATVAWALHPEDGTDGDTLLRTADRRLYAAKGDSVRA
jgi:diguanylate cyclase (GGDEF)-like protein